MSRKYKASTTQVRGTRKRASHFDLTWWPRDCRIKRILIHSTLKSVFICRRANFMSLPLIS